MKLIRLLQKQNSIRLLVLGCSALLLAAIIGFTTKPASAVTAGGGGGQAQTVNVDNCKKKFFGLVPWYYYIDQEFQSGTPGVGGGDKCDIKCFNLFNQTEVNECGKKSSDLPAVMLAIIDDLLRIAGIVAVAFVLVGAFQYTTSGGNSEQTAKARSTLINAFGGLAIALVAVAFVSFIGSRLN